MDIALRRLEQIDSVYQTMNIYRTLILYRSEDEFLCLRKLMEDQDYSFWSRDHENARIYSWSTSSIGDNMDAIDWDTISAIICLDEEAMEIAKQISADIHNFILLIKI